MKPELQTRELRQDGYIATLRRARVAHACRWCHQPIEAGQQYYEVVLGGGGLGWLKYPTRVHTSACLDNYLSSRR